MARKLDAIERGSPIEQTFKFEAWRAKYSKSGGAGRAGVIAMLEAAQPKSEQHKSEANGETSVAIAPASAATATEVDAAGGAEQKTEEAGAPSETLEEAQAAEEAEAMDEVDALEALA